MTNLQLPEIESTADGSVTLYRKDIDEHYHSVKGALAESLHIYLGLGWEALSSGKSPIRLFEAGYGTGLNAVLTASAALRMRIPTEYYSVEKYPLPPDVTEELLRHQPTELKDYFRKVNLAEWDRAISINEFFILHKMEDDLLTMDIPQDIDVVYFDAFAPEKQPEIWSENIFRKIYEAMAPGGILTTYCAKGSIRRLLGQVGFLTERLPGPPGGKREVLRAGKPDTQDPLIIK